MDTIIPQKRCTACYQEYPATTEYFHKHKATIDHLRPQCKGCRSAEAKRIRREKNPRSLIPSGYKQCGHCKQIKPATREYFTPAKRFSYGLASWCKECANKRGKEYNAAKRKPIELAPTGYKRCTACKQLFPATLDYFGKRKDHKDGLEGRCLTCLRRSRNENRRKRCLDESYKSFLRQSQKQYYNPEKKRLYMLAHYEQVQANRRNRKARVRNIAGQHTGQDIKLQYQRQKGKCYYCRNKVKWGEHHVDHTFPISRVAGTDIPANDISYLVITCIPCNLSKHDKFPWEWPEGGRLF